MATLRVGVLGCANIARKTVRGIGKSDRVKVVAVASRAVEKAEKFIADESIPDAKAYGSYEEVLALDDVDAVYLPLPTSTHVEWVRKAAAAKKHIVLEKPIALSEEDVSSILAAVREGGVQLLDGTMWVHNARTEAMKADLAQLGQLKHVATTFCFYGSEDFMANDIRVKADGDALGALGDIGWYCVRAILWAYGWELPETVVAHPGVEWTADGVVPISIGATLTFPGGRTGAFWVSFRGALTADLKVIGSDGTLSLNDFCIPHIETEARYTVTSKNGFLKGDSVISTVYDTKTIELPVPQETSLWESLADQVAEAARTGGPFDPFWPELAASTQRVLFSVLESAKKGGAPVRFGEPASDA